MIKKWINQPAFPVLKKQISWLPVGGGVCYPKENILIDLFDSRSGSCTGRCTSTWHTSSTWGHTSGHTTWGTTCSLVKLSNDWVANAFNLENEINVVLFRYLYQIMQVFKAELLQVGIFFFVYLFAWEILQLKKLKIEETKTAQFQLWKPMYYWK